jgi:hypothetical protein
MLTLYIDIEEEKYQPIFLTTQTWISTRNNSGLNIMLEETI